MKLIQKILGMALVLLAFGFTACDRDYDAPTLNEPSVAGSVPTDASYYITIDSLRTLTAAATSSAPVSITDSLWLKARICGDDRSGNIYKTVYLQDETGGISFLVDQSNVFNDYPAGQEVYVNLKGLVISVYGNEQQIGYPTGYLYRAPYANFKEHVLKNGWPDESKLTIKEIDNISNLTADDRFTLVCLKNVHFSEAGTATYAETSGYGTHDLADEWGNTISVRTSNYADFAAETLPIGTGNVIAVLGRYNGSWQLTLRSTSDVYGFDGVPWQQEEDETDGTVIFSETMGSSSVSKVDGYWPYVEAFTGWSNPSLTFSCTEKTLSVRNVSSTNNIWFPANKDLDFSITGFSTEGYNSLTLTYDLAANLYNDTGEVDAAAMTGTLNGVAFTTPSQTLSGPNGDNNKFYTISIDFGADAISANGELHFIVAAANNGVGLRLANIKLVGKK